MTACRRQIQRGATLLRLCDSRIFRKQWPRARQAAGDAPFASSSPASANSLHAHSGPDQGPRSHTGPGEAPLALGPWRWEGKGVAGCPREGSAGLTGRLVSLARFADPSQAFPACLVVQVPGFPHDPPAHRSTNELLGTGGRSGWEACRIWKGSSCGGFARPESSWGLSHEHESPPCLPLSLPRCAAGTGAYCGSATVWAGNQSGLANGGLQRRRVGRFISRLGPRPDEWPPCASRSELVESPFRPGGSFRVRSTPSSRDTQVAFAGA